MLFDFDERKVLTEIGISFINNIECWRTFNSEFLFLKANFDENRYDPNIYTKLRVNFPREIYKSVSKRQAEYLAGRVLAKIGIRELKNNVDQSENIDVLQGANRCPIWPENIYGSIAHSGDTVICALSGNSVLIGTDVEALLNTQVAKGIASTVHSEYEESLFIEVGYSPTTATSVIFSAKESLFKALYPKVETYFGFECAEVIRVSSDKNVLEIKINQEFAQRFKLKRLYRCAYFLDGKNVITLICGSVI